jgi:hypothetical protein
MGELLLGCSGWNYGDILRMVGGLEYFILLPKPKDSAIIRNFSILQK